MREIKFRAWDKLNKEMVQVYVLNQTSRAGTEFNAYKSRGYIIGEKPGSDQREFYLHDVELMQYTGLKDKALVE